MRKKLTDNTDELAVPNDQHSQESYSRYDDLKREIERAYNGDVTITDAERLAAKFLLAKMEIAAELAVVDLDSRMKKNGLKAKRATVYMGAVASADKKPSDTLLENHCNLDPGVQLSMNEFEEADAKRESLKIYMDIFLNAHIYFRSLSRQG